jgi:2Fe-2S ferredoxin
MDGQHSHPDERSAQSSSLKFKVRFLYGQGEERIVDVDQAAPLTVRRGRPGSLLQIALSHGIEIDHACGGMCACSTCHVVVRGGYDACQAPTEEEEDQLDDAYGLTPHSRLACQCVPTGAQDLVVEVPVWNRNLAREEH